MSVKKNKRISAGKGAALLEAGLTNPFMTLAKRFGVTGLRKDRKQRPPQREFTKIRPEVITSWNSFGQRPASKQQLKVKLRQNEKRTTYTRELMERNDYRKYKGLTAITAL